MTAAGPPLDVLVVGSGPTGVAVGAEAKQAGLSVALFDAGPLQANLLGFPTYMTWFTTRDRMEIGGVPFSIPEDKADRRQALAYYRSVVAHHDLEVRTHSKVVRIRPSQQGLLAEIAPREGGSYLQPARTVVVATGYFGAPRRLAVPGADLPWVHTRYLEPYRHYGEHVVLVGAGNSAAEAALEIWRAGIEVSLVHRGREIKPTVKYWVRPDVENRIAEGSIGAHFERTVEAFEVRDGRRGLVLAGGEDHEFLPADAVYVLIGYDIDASLLEASGVVVDAVEKIPAFDEESGETDVPGLYVAGAVRSGIHTNRIFIDNSRDHASRIVEHIAGRLRGRAVAAGGSA